MYLYDTDAMHQFADMHRRCLGNTCFFATSSLSLNSSLSSIITIISKSKSKQIKRVQSR